MVYLKDDFSVFWSTKVICKVFHNLKSVGWTKVNVLKCELISSSYDKLCFNTTTKAGLFDGQMENYSISLFMYIMSFTTLTDLKT